MDNEETHCHKKFAVSYENSPLARVNLHIFVSSTDVRAQGSYLDFPGMQGGEKCPKLSVMAFQDDRGIVNCISPETCDNVKAKLISRNTYKNYVDI